MTILAKGALECMVERGTLPRLEDLVGVGTMTILTSTWEINEQFFFLVPFLRATKHSGRCLVLVGGGYTLRVCIFASLLSRLMVFLASLVVSLFLLVFVC